MMNSKLKSTNKYDDIINLPHHVSDRHPQMSIYNRAAQFSPFAALTGYEDAVAETARLTDYKIELDENKKNELDEKLSILKERLENAKIRPYIQLTVFEDDIRKDGGKYVNYIGNLKNTDVVARTLILEDGKVFAINSIYEIDILD